MAREGYSGGCGGHFRKLSCRCARHTHPDLALLGFHDWAHRLLAMKRTGAVREDRAAWRWGRWFDLDGWILLLTTHAHAGYVEGCFLQICPNFGAIESLLAARARMCHLRRRGIAETPECVMCLFEIHLLCFLMPSGAVPIFASIF